MAAFTYIGEGEGTEAFGLLFPRNSPVDVADEYAIRKLSNNPQFVSVVDGVEVLDPEPKRRGRPRKAE
jgi:hypothetical protein